jgi:putative MATE family efflux protein
LSAVAAPAASTTSGARSGAASNPLLVGPILPTLLRLAVPNVLAMATAVLVGIAETAYIGLLGTVPLAAMALVFPFAMLTQMMSGGAMGGGVSSAVSRALGAGDVERARVLAVHAVLIAVFAGVLYTVIFLLWGPVFYRALGGRGEILAEAVRYSNVLFLGAVLIWLTNCLASVVRGTGNMRVPSAAILGSSLVQIALGGALGLGLGPFPRLGMTGVAIGSIVGFLISTAVLLWYLMAGRGRLKMRFAGVRPQWPLFADILKVGAVACFSPLQAVAATLVFTGLIAQLGPMVLAGYGIGQRLEFLLIPIAFGIGVAAVPMVGMAIGAGQLERAAKVIWTAGWVSAFNLTVLGILVALVPALWANLFSKEPAVLQTAYQYLQYVGPVFGFFGFGLTLYFASQGTGRILGPVLASTTRLIVVIGAGLWLLPRTQEAGPFYVLVGVAMVVYGLSTAYAVSRTLKGFRERASLAVAPSR